MRPRSASGPGLPCPALAFELDTTRPGISHHVAEIVNLSRSALLAVGLAWGAAIPVLAQMTSGPGLSSGTGAGTGAGGFSGVIRNQAGSISGMGPSPSSTFVGSPLPGPLPAR